MRPMVSFFVIACATAAWSVAAPALAQYGGGPGGGANQQEQDEKQRKHDEIWGKNNKNLALPQLRNAGPCPYVKILYDAARYVELKDNQEIPSAVGFTGELEGLSSNCEYKKAQPIRVQARLLFWLGRGPQAHGNRKTYRYWVAVTDRNHAVLAKQYFDLPVVFPPGKHRTQATQDVFGITIPRAGEKVSGGNFEVLVGFDVTPQMAEFNRMGKRFRPNVNLAAQASPSAHP